MEYTLPMNCSLIDGVQSMTSVSYFGGGGVSVSGRLLLLLESYSTYGGGTSLGFCVVAKDILVFEAIKVKLLGVVLFCFLLSFNLG